MKPFRIALVQMGVVTDDKAHNLRHAHELIRQAVRGGAEGKKPDMIVLPVRFQSKLLFAINSTVCGSCQECFNSLYGYKFFPQYAETIAYKESDKYDVESSQSESVKMLSGAAKEAGVWLIGGLLGRSTLVQNRFVDSVSFRLRA